MLILIYIYNTNNNLGSEPLLNVMCMGWSEDGRLGMPPDQVPKYMLTKATPVAGLRANTQLKGRHRIKQFICRSASAGQRHTLFLMTNIHLDLEPNKGGNKRYEVTKLVLVLLLVLALVLVLLLVLLLTL